MAELASTSLFSDANLQAYYKLENVNDSKGSNNLTNNNSVAFNAAKYNLGADLGANNTTKYLSRATNLGIDGGAISFGGWFNWNTLTNRTFLALSSNTSNVRYFLSYNSTTTLSFGREKINVAFQSVDATISQIVTGAWHHIVLTYDGATITGYLDGVSIGTPASVSGNGSGTNSNYFYIGSYDATNFASVIADDIFVFSRALTAAEVLTLYKAGTGGAFLMNFV